MGQAYRGAIGRTQTATVHVADARGDLISAQITTSIDATSDPALVARLHDDTLNVARPGDGDAGAPTRLSVPVIYHDPAVELLVLVLGEAHRHRELEERIAVLDQLRRDPATVPPYAKDFAVVFGAAGLRELIAQRGHRRAAAELERASRELAQRTELERTSRELALRTAELERASRELAQRTAELERASRELAQRTGELDAARAELDTLRGDARVADTDRFDAAEPPAEEVDPGDDPLTTELVELSIDAAGHAPDDALDDAIARLETACHVDRAGVRVVVIAGDQLASGLTGALDVRLVLHRVASYPVVALVIGAPADLRAPAVSRLVVVPLDIAAEPDRSVLRELGRVFELTIDLVSHGRRFRRCRLNAPLADNAAYVLRAADDHLRGIAADGEPHYGAARELVLGPGFDLLGAEHAERGELRDDKLAQIATAQQVRRALAMARRFSRPAREDYLVCTRGFPIPRWRQRRRDILVRAVAWGLWMGPELAQVAVSEGIARSRRDLITRLVRGFEGLRHNTVAFDLDPDAAADNAAALADEARELGVDVRPAKPNGAGAIASDTAPVVSGSISSTPGRGTPTSWSTEDLLAELEHTGPQNGRRHRVAAALVLCDRGDPGAAGPVIAAAMKMSRGEAVRVLAMSIKFGAVAAPALVEGLSASKAYVRHGCALALALLGSEGSTDAVIGLLLSEPTELWREIARAIGRIGSEALIPLARHYGRLGDRAVLSSERVAWAMAHIAVRGGQDAVAALASGQGVMAGLAGRSIELLSVASGDRTRERTDAAAAGSERDLTVNHAFSRQFFEALEHGLPDATELDAAATAEP
jgi:hypothetical protein